MVFSPFLSPINHETILIMLIIREGIVIYNGYIVPGARLWKIVKNIVTTGVIIIDIIMTKLLDTVLSTRHDAKNMKYDKMNK